MRRAQYIELAPPPERGPALPGDPRRTSDAVRRFAPELGAPVMPVVHWSGARRLRVAGVVALAAFLGCAALVLAFYVFTPH